MAPAVHFLKICVRASGPPAHVQKKRTDRLENMAPPALIAMIQGQGWYFSSSVPHVRAAKRLIPNRMPTEWREGKEKFERGHIGDDQLLRGTQKCDIFFKGTQVKASQ